MDFTYSVCSATLQDTPVLKIVDNHLKLKQGGHNLENLEYSGISLNVENWGNSQGILCNLGEKL